ncbi:MAG: DNA replication/repair protein RecF [Bacteroidales bacterium]|nr:DNA replication/repair protein RecF [Bacteroidales bacterium]
MYLEKLRLNQFKNYSEQEFEFSEKINCFSGRNGSGKTNVLDAIYYLSFCKSYFNPSDQQNIQHGKDFFAIQGVYRKNGTLPDKLSCVQERGQRKKFKCNDKEYDRFADHIGLFPLVMVSPYDRDLINDGSEIRRKLIDSVISQFNRLYLEDLILYNKALAQRNSLLKKIANSSAVSYGSFEIWDRQLVKLGEKILSERETFIRGFLPHFSEYYEMISGRDEEVNLVYESHLQAGNLAGMLIGSFDRDLAAGFTTKGIHKDDLHFTISGYPVKKFGSQGQQKSFVLALRLAQFRYIHQIKGFKPVLLLDDIFDKLDGERVQHIINLVSKNNFGQVFITDTQKERIEDIFRTLDIDRKIFEVEKGEIIRSFVAGKE